MSEENKAAADKYEVFDAEAVYDAEIVPKMQEVLALCNKYGIPMVATFCYSQDAGGQAGVGCVVQLGPRERVPDKLIMLAAVGSGKINIAGMIPSSALVPIHKTPGTVQ